MQRQKTQFIQTVKLYLLPRVLYFVHFKSPEKKTTSKQSSKLYFQLSRQVYAQPKHHFCGAVLYGVFFIYFNIYSQSQFPADMPIWYYDGSNTDQATADNSDTFLFPEKIFHDPFRRGKHIMVLSDTYHYNYQPTRKYKAVFTLGRQIVANRGRYLMLSRWSRQNRRASLLVVFGT